MRLTPLLCLLAAAPLAAEPARLWFQEPAASWNEALPVGNGRLGAMVFGRTADERIQFNESTLWTGRPHDYVRPGAREALPEIRRLLFAGRTKEAEQLAKEKFLSNPVRQKAYQPFGDVRLRFPGHEHATDYRRELDLESAVARVRYRVGDVTFRREIFASHPAQAIVMRLAADRPGQISFTLKLDSPHRLSQTAAAGPDGLLLTGQVEAGGERFAARLQTRATGGRVAAGEGELSITGADSVVLLLTAATSYRNFEDIGADPDERCTAALARLNAADYDQLLAAHTADYRALFGRVTLDLGHSPRAALPTNERVRQAKQSGLDGDPALAALYFQFGRYLLIASSRPGGLPANLQGIWNESLDPPWESKWTTNINLEMNYWPAEVTNLAECHEPLFDLIRGLTQSGARTAREQYGAGGWVLHHNTDLWLGTAPINGIDGIWPTGGAWLCWHLWEHWRFTGDREFLATRAWPALRGAAQFFADVLVPDPRTGWLVTAPSYSPEQGPLTVGPTMDNQLIRALCNATIETAGILNTDQDFAHKLAAIRDRLPPNQIGRHGQLQEWLDDVDKPDNAHRHMSPLWALYPGADLTPVDEKVFAAAKKLLAWRGDGSTGWSYAWRIALWARVGDGGFAYRQFTALIQRKTLPNLFDLGGPFQIDGNFGATAGIAEMLLQSHQRSADASRAVVLDLLPALPPAWPAGAGRGLRARDGFEVDLEWTGGALRRAVIHAHLARPCRVRAGGREIALTPAAGATIALDAELRPVAK